MVNQMWYLIHRLFSYQAWSCILMLLEVTTLTFRVKLDEFYSHVHTLGIYHEHNRSDGDQYVKIYCTFIYTHIHLYFQKQDTNNPNTPYDNSSVMHYPIWISSFNGKDTITPIPNLSVKIGC
ncbi:unnamed protein product [Oncorhynchus mykiss]|uniref:Peptidase M12A domain-containing protein n=1 Tax=Oncorhynchus mykiss TaxID=8022 RepID=A0A060WG65_ONCMY|nr:unnamed protein product [Oncorhynchus mykiss]